MAEKQTKNMKTYSVPYRLDFEHRRCVVGDEPMLFHCHHYNTFLQRSIEDADYIDSQPFLVGAAAEVAYAQMQNLFSAVNVGDEKRRKQLAGELFRWAGFGSLDLGTIKETGGTVSTPHSHYAVAWKSKFGDSNRPVCHFVEGWLAGTAAAIYNQPFASYSVEETSCKSKHSDNKCEFSIRQGRPNWSVFNPVGMGQLHDHKPLPVEKNNVDYDGILNAVSGMELVGDQNGLIPAFGVYLTRMYANYYNRISFEFEHALSNKFGKEGIDVARPLLVEAGHVCAFNTFGGIMTSPEWDALIKPNLKSKEDWVHGMVAVANSLGWGRWQAPHVSEKETEFVIHDDYESVGYRAMYGKCDHSVSYLAEGAVIGLMNLVYVGKVHNKPAFTPEFYNDLFKRNTYYKAEVVSSLATGDKVTTIKVKKV